jgi:hypothetical protein
MLCDIQVNNVMYVMLIMLLLTLHTGGGVVSALAARRPDLVHSVLLIEPPLFNPFKRFIWALLTRLVSRSLAEKYHPIIEGEGTWMRALGCSITGVYVLLSVFCE